MWTKRAPAILFACLNLWVTTGQINSVRGDTFLEGSTISATGAEGGGVKKKPPGFDQAVDVDKILSDMSRYREKLVPALEKVRKCNHPENGTAIVSQVTESRKRQLRATRNLKVDKLPRGRDIQYRLDDALSASLFADEAFLVWARRHTAKKCSADWKKNPDYQLGLQYSEAATISKEGFIDIWNPVAQKYGLKLRTARGI